LLRPVGEPLSARTALHGALYKALSFMRWQIIGGSTCSLTDSQRYSSRSEARPIYLKMRDFAAAHVQLNSYPGLKENKPNLIEVKPQVTL
jgi:hypothetical protein